MTKFRDGFIPDWPTQRRFPRTEQEAFRLYGIAVTGYRQPFFITLLRVIAWLCIAAAIGSVLFAVIA